MKFHGTKIDERAQSLSIDLGSRSLLSHFAALIRRHFSPFVRWNRAEGNYARNICSPSSNPFDQFESIDKRPSTSMNKALDVFFIFLFFFFATILVIQGFARVRAIETRWRRADRSNRIVRNHANCHGTETAISTECFVYC